MSSWAVVWRQPINDVITERHTGMHGSASCNRIPAGTSSRTREGIIYFRGCLCKGLDQKSRNDVLDAPILVTAGGLFHYFEEHKVIALLRMIGQFGNMEVVFDTVNKEE